MSNKQLKFHPIIGSIQRIALYETKAVRILFLYKITFKLIILFIKLVRSIFQRFYLIGSNNTQTRFRVLKIDRTDPRELVIVDDKVEYNQQEIHQLVDMIDNGNRSARSGGVAKLVSAFGIIGFYSIYTRLDRVHVR